MIQVKLNKNENGEKLLRRFSSHVRSTKIMQKFRKARNFKKTERKIKVRQAAISREAHRAENKRKQFLQG